MSYYRHTQRGTLILAFIGAALAGILLVAAETGAHPALILTGALIAAAGFLFGSLTVEVDASALRTAFGPGLIRKAFPLSEIQEARPVRNRWWYGWGIRLLPGGWLFNVSGLDAVEILMASGRRYRIGTDEPEKLAEVIGSCAGAGR